VRTARSGRAGRPPDPALELRLDVIPPYDWDSINGFLAARAIPGIEVVEADRYRRTIDVGGLHGIIEVWPVLEQGFFGAAIQFPDGAMLPEIERRIRRVFDLDTDVARIEAHLAADPVLGPLIAARPGLRVPGAWDGFELAVRAMLGQQITVNGARQLLGRLVEGHGATLQVAAAESGTDGLTAVFPAPERLAAADLRSLGMPRARAAAISGLAAAAAADSRLFQAGASLEAAIARFVALPGVGDWTAQYVAMRALREPDAFPAADVGLLRAMADAHGVRPTPTALLARAEPWRPWRAYAAQHLWTALAAGEALRAAHIARIAGLA
jgi:AraC family transcriptional regulator, regulatory protein of adaptative response / DNA-3-methyladenine glycosylase II